MNVENGATLKLPIYLVLITMMMINKRFTVEIELETFEVTVSAKNTSEAKAKALIQLRNKNAALLIKKSYPNNKKQIHINEY